MFDKDALALPLVNADQGSPVRGQDAASGHEVIYRGNALMGSCSGAELAALVDIIDEEPASPLLLGRGAARAVRRRSLVIVKPASSAIDLRPDHPGIGDPAAALAEHAPSGS
jgi:hypothetical protein